MDAWSWILEGGSRDWLKILQIIFLEVVYSQREDSYRKSSIFSIILNIVIVLKDYV